jgi:hypothetical protein
MQRLGLFALFAGLSAAAWCFFVPLFVLFFSWTEYTSGINWIYLPHGLRMMLVLMFGLPGAIGFSIGAHILWWSELDGVTPNPLVDLPLAFVPGVAAYCAALMTLRTWPGRGLLPRIGEGIPAIDGRQLLLLAFASAVLNSGGHIFIRAVFGDEKWRLDDDFITMLIGDFFGALLLLYGLKKIIVFFENKHRRTRVP